VAGGFVIWMFVPFIRLFTSSEEQGWGGVAVMALMGLSASGLLIDLVIQLAVNHWWPSHFFLLKNILGSLILMAFCLWEYGDRYNRKPKNNKT